MANGSDGMAIWTKPAGLPGDYNGNGTVDASDYVLWRETQNQTGVNLAADGSGNGIVGQEDYLLWRSRFGQTTAAAGTSAYAASDSVNAVPEPTTFILLIAGFCRSFKLRRRIET